MRLIKAVIAAVLLASCATPAAEPIANAEGQAPAWSSLSRFNSDAELQAYIDAAALARAQALARMRGVHANDEPATPECPPDQPECQNLEAVVVTGSRVAAPAPSSTVTSITNVQTAGVDEGDIVKMIGRFVIVLQDGRLFSIDTGRAPGELRLADRANVYRSADADVWYDEILVHDRRILVTGYNYGADSTEFTVFSLSDTGHLTREETYFISSDDYYDGDNYATRLVDGNLVIYTPLQDLNYDDHDQLKWPLVRRWLREGEDAPAMSRGRPLFNARDIYRPIQSTLDPTIHTISVCPLGSARAGDELDCRSTAVIGPPEREFYVSNDHVYLWLAAGRSYWEPPPHCPSAPAQDSALFQIGVADGRLRALFTHGAPIDQLSLEATTDHFHALTSWEDEPCNEPADDEPLIYFSAPLAAFSTTPQPTPASAFTPVPNVGNGVENRFTNGHLVYGGGSDWYSYLYIQADPPRSGRVVVLPSDNPAAAQTLEAPHGIIRVESIGDAAVLTGYRDTNALSISVLDLTGAPRIADTVLLEHRFESEGRSHAFNAAIEPDGSGVLGLPTSDAQWRSGRWVWDSMSSDVSFIQLSADHRLQRLGELASRANATDPSYRCEVSCIDWYGNARPLFVAGRVFALSGTELIEGYVGEGRIEERTRVNLTAPRKRRTAR